MAPSGLRCWSAIRNGMNHNELPQLHPIPMIEAVLNQGQAEDEILACLTAQEEP